jgi:hypothetical protein
VDTLDTLDLSALENLEALAAGNYVALPAAVIFSPGPHNKSRRGSRKRGKKKKIPPPPYYFTEWGDTLTKNVENLSSYQPSNAEKTILSLGLGFGISSPHDPVRVLRDLRVFESRIRAREFFLNPRNKDAIAAMERKKTQGASDKSSETRT